MFNVNLFSLFFSSTCITSFNCKLVFFFLCLYNWNSHRVIYDCCCVAYISCINKYKWIYIEYINKAHHYNWNELEMLKNEPFWKINFIWFTRCLFANFFFYFLNQKLKTKKKYFAHSSFHSFLFFAFWFEFLILISNLLANFVSFSQFKKENLFVIFILLLTFHSLFSQNILSMRTIFNIFYFKHEWCDA